MVAALPPGLTHLALRCTVPGDFAAMAPAHDGWRTREHDLLARGFVRDLCATEGVGVTSTRALQARWRDHLSVGGATAD